MILFVLLCFFSCGNTQTLTGCWVGTMETKGKTVDISIDLTSEDKFLSSSDMGLFEQPISKLIVNDNSISFSVVLEVEINFTGTIIEDKMEGTVTINNGAPDWNILFSLSKQAKNNSEKPYSVERLTIKSNDVLLSAEIFKPHTKGLHPAIVLLHGSSPSVKTNFNYKADYFARLGFEVLIYDKRGCGQSTGSYDFSNNDDLIADAIVCLETMYKRESVNKDKIGLWGISQGGMFLSKIASKTAMPKFLIAVSPEIISVVEAAAFSDSLRVIGLGYSEKDAHIVAKSHRKVGKIIQEGKGYSEVESFIRQNAQQYNFMNQTGLNGNVNIEKDEFDGFYWKGRIDQYYSLWKNIKIPTLVLFGEDDDLVNAKKNSSMLISFNNANIEVKLFQNADHSIRKSYNPSVDNEFNWPRMITAYSESIEMWLKREVVK